MIIPSLLPVLSPVVLYFIILSIGGQVAALAAVGAMLLGSYYYRIIRCSFNDCRWWCLG
jgi:Na+/H+-translocating membrane pyrophosphatase